MKDPISDEDETRPFRKEAGTFFEKATGEDAMVVTTMTAVLALVGSTPESLTPEELSHLLPEVERRLRLLSHPDQANNQIARLRSILIHS